MNSTFKTLLVEPGVFGNIIVHNGTVLVGTSSKPGLYDSSATVEDLAKYFSNFRVVGLDRNFDWDTDIYERK